MGSLRRRHSRHVPRIASKELGYTTRVVDEGSQARFDETCANARLFGRSPRLRNFRRAESIRSSACAHTRRIWTLISSGRLAKRTRGGSGAVVAPVGSGSCGGSGSPCSLAVWKLSACSKASALALTYSCSVRCVSEARSGVWNGLRTPKGNGKSDDMLLHGRRDAPKQLPSRALNATRGAYVSCEELVSRNVGGSRSA